MKKFSSTSAFIAFLCLIVVFMICAVVAIFRLSDKGDSLISNSSIPDPVPALDSGLLQPATALCGITYLDDRQDYTDIILFSGPHKDDKEKSRIQTDQPVRITERSGDRVYINDDKKIQGWIEYQQVQYTPCP